jgi:polyisoprenoid-binding protein YceI
MARYRISPERSRVWVDTRTSLHPIHGQATGLEGTIEVEVSDGRLDLSTPPRARVALPLERLTSGNPLYDGELRRRVDVRRYPTIEGEVREVREAGPGRYRVRGDLTFHGTTRTVEGEVSLSVDGSRLEIQGERSFNVEEFGVKAPRILMLRVYPDVNVRVRMVAEREEP